jgi:hypothetical protein
VSIEAPVTDPELGKRLTDEITHPETAGEPLKAEFKVVVGRVRLVKFLFGKTSPPQTPGKKKGEKQEPFFKRMWHKIVPPSSG